ncbi:MAG: hypothetical protein ABII27_00510 [bacterium]
MIDIKSDLLKFLSRLKNLLVEPGFKRKLLITAAVIIVYKIVSFIPVPLIGQTAGNTHYSIVVLGLWPFINAHIIALLIWVIPSVQNNFWKTNWFNKGNFVVVLITIILALIHSVVLTNYFIASDSLESINVLSRVTIIVTLLGGVFIYIILGSLINNYGIGHGFSLIISLEIIQTIYIKYTEFIKHILYWNKNIPVILGYFLLFAVSFAVVGISVAVIYIIIRKETVSLPGKISFKVPIFIIGLLPYFIVSFFCIYIISQFISSNFYIFMYFQAMVVMLVIYRYYCPLIMHSEELAGRFNEKLKLPEQIDKNALEKPLNKASLLWGLFIFALLLSYIILHKITHVGFAIGISIGVQGLLFVGYLTLLFISLTKDKNFVEIAKHSDDTYFFEMQALLSSNGIESKVYGKEAFGRVWGFQMGPLAEKILLVKGADIEKSKNILQDYIK